MWFLDKVEPKPEHGAAFGSRAVLLLAISFLIVCIFHASFSLASDDNGRGLIQAVYKQSLML